MENFFKQNKVKIIALAILLIAGLSIYFYLSKQDNAPINQSGTKTNTNKQKSVASELLEVSSGYKEISNLVEVGGKLYYLADGKIMVYDGISNNEIHLNPSNNEKINCLKNINNQLAYVVDGGLEVVNGIYQQKESYLQYGNKTFKDLGSLPQCDSIIAVRDGVVYLISKGGHLSVAKNGNIITATTRRLLKSLGGEPFYSKMYYTPEGAQRSVLVYGEKEIGGEDCSDVVLINNKIACQVDREILCSFGSTNCPADSWSELYYDGKKIENQNYHSVYSPFEYSGKLSYIADIKSGTGSNSVIVSDGKEITPEYESIYEVKMIEGKLAYSAENKRRYFVIYNNRKIGADYDFVSHITAIGNRVAFIVEKSPTPPAPANPIFYAIVFDGQEIGKEYIKVSEITALNNKLAFVAEKKDGAMIVVVEK